MFRIDDVSASATLPTPEAAGTEGYWTEGNPATGVPATLERASWFNMLQEELRAIVVAGGLTPSKTVYNQVLSAINTLAQNSSALVGATSGTSDAIIGTFSPVPAAAINGAPLLIRAASANATTTPTFTPNSGVITAKNIVKGAGSALAAGDIAGAGHWIELQYDLTLDKWVLLNPATGVTSTTSVSVARRQTVLSGPVDTSGYPSFLPATSASLVLTTQNVSTGSAALVATASGGSNASGDINVVGQVTSNSLSWTVPASNTSWLPVSIAASALTALTPVTLQPIIQWGGTPAVTAGQYTYNIQQGIMWLGNGSVANAVNHVIVGEVVAGASTITSAIAYAYKGRYSSGRFSISNSTGYNKNHKLGTPPDFMRVRAAGATSTGGALSDFANIYNAPNYYGGYFQSLDRNSVTFFVGNPAQVYSGNVGATPVEAQITIDRGDW